MSEVNKNISWVEPNLIFSETVGEKTYEITPPMEDYCIAVDLEVEIMKRGKGGVTEPVRTILVSWTSKSNEKDNISFFAGTKHKYGDSVGVNYLTTNPTTFGTFEEVKSEGTNECFGINSIDIQYNSYMVPEVTIEFTDIRGISLFSPEELRHQAVDENGIGGMVDYRDNIAGSFFKCFFTFPYPRFKLMVKGFYGEPTSYELTVADFRTRFDCSTGNFNATAKFVGYSYSLLNDITMNALVVAPLNEYAGKKWWDDNIENRTFTFSDGSKMLRFDEILKRTTELKKHLEKHSNESVEAQKANDLSIENNKILTINNLHNEFFIELCKYFKERKLSSENNPIIDNAHKTMIFFLKEENLKEIEVVGSVKDKYNSLRDGLKNYGNNLDKFLKYGEELTKYPNQLYNESVEEIKYICGEDYQTKLGINFTEGGKWYVIIYNGSELQDKINAIKTKNSNDITENQKLISQINKEAVIKALGFNPTVENVTKLLFAHFETLIHSIYYCTRNINGRSATSLGIKTSDIITTEENVDVGPFPRVDIERTYNGITSTEEGWLGDLAGGVNEQEVQLIEGLLKGVSDFAKVANETSQELLQSGSSANYETTMLIPVTPLDIVMDTNPYGDNINFNDISDFIGKVALRAMSVINTHINVTKGDEIKMGKADAYNFKAKFPRVGANFLKRLCGSSDAISYDLFDDVLRNKNQNEKINNKWAWDSNNSDSTHMTDNSYLTLYDVSIENNQKSKVLPVTNINWEEINSSIRMNKLPNSLDNFVTTTYVGKNCKNIFIIDENYDYNGFASKMKVDNESFKYVDDLNLSFNAEEYLHEFFYDDERIFGKRFDKISTDISYNPYEDSHILPFKKPLSINDINKVDIFGGSSNFDDNFEEFEDENGKDFDRDGEGSFNSAIGEINNISSYTIPMFRGVEDKEDFTYDWSIFGQQDYYSISTIEGKALAFLDTLKLKEEGFNFGGFRFDDYVADNDKNITKHILNADEPFMIMPYLGMVLLGGYFWREHYINEYNSDPLGGYIHESKLNNPKAAICYSINSDLFELRQEIKDTLIEEFKKWVDDGVGCGFKKIQENFELPNVEFLNNLINEIKKPSRDRNIELFLFKNANEKFYENYISFKESAGKLKLYNRETSSAVQAFAKAILKPCMVIKPTRYIFESNTNIIYAGSKIKGYIDSFLSKLKELYAKDYENSVGEPITINPIKTSDHIKNSLYKYIKILYDKWLSGSKEEDWNLFNFYETNWHFLDSFYNKVGDRVMIDMVKFCGDILYSQKESGYSLLSFISKAYATNRFNLHCVQNFMDLKNEHQDEKFHKMFKPIPYNEIDFLNINFHPAFILMYTYEYSSKLDIKGAEYKSDSFNLDENKDLPTQITSKNLENGYRIPAFGVTYGKQYQHYFKNIDVSTDNPIVTEEAIKAQFMIAGMESNIGENGKKISFLGQDLYTIYSNNSYTCTVKMMGCAWVQPLMYFQLNNIPMFRGAYLIQKVSHHIEPGNMETTFVGVRMAKQTTKLVDDPVFSNDNDQVSPQEQGIIENALAEVTNDCKYSFYNPNEDFDYPSMSIEDLTMTIADYQTKYGKKFNAVVPTSMTSIRHLLGSVVKSESENQDKLGKQLVAVVLFNRYMHFGKDLTKMFYDSQHAFNKTCVDEDKDEYIKIITEIFTKSPLILEGTMTNIKDSFPILSNSSPTGNKTQPIALTAHMLKSMDGYCTTIGYDLSGRFNGIKKEPKGWWHKAEYECQHDNVEDDVFGHVFVSGAWDKAIEHWQPKEKKAYSENSNPSEKAIGLFEAIKKTLNDSKAINCKEVLMEKDIANDRDTFYLIVKPEEKMIDAFDAIVNTYYDYFSQCNWIVNNDGKEIPLKIRVKAEENPKERVISIAKLKSNGSIDNFNTHEELNDKFYITLQKKYGVIDTNNKDIFKQECMNFNKLSSTDIDWVNIANNFLNNKIEPCGGEVNLPIVDGYQWDGDLNDVQNHNKPTTPFPKQQNVTRNSTPISGYDHLLAADYAKRNANSKSIGKCAAYVSKAMRDAGAGSMSDRPMSACAYSKFMKFWGFTEVYSNFGATMEGYEPQKGDVAVIAGTNKKKHGHIHIYNDGMWYSDFGCRTPWCYGDEGRPYIVYRWENNPTA